MTARSFAFALLAMFALPSFAHADIFMTRRADGTVHFSNIPNQRRNGSVTVVRGRDASHTPGGSQVISLSGSGAPSSSAAALPQNAYLRSLYQSAARDSSRYSRYDEHIREAATLYQLPEALLRAVIKQESDFNNYSVSSSGACGLMQLMPSTAQSMMVRDVFDPRQSILGGGRFLRLLANMFNGDLVLTLAAYNAGPNAVVRYSGVPPYDETQNYVRNVLRYYYLYRAGQGPGGNPAPATPSVPAAPPPAMEAPAAENTAPTPTPASAPRVPTTTPPAATAEPEGPLPSPVGVPGSVLRISAAAP